MSQYRTLISLISCQEAGTAYGLEPNRAGFCRCPFHNEKTGSMKLYEDDRGWYCFGCHKGGNVITLVQGIFSLECKEAMQKLNDDFCCGMEIGELSKAKAADLERLQAQRKKEAAVYNQFMQWKMDMCDLMQRVVHVADMAERYKLLPKCRTVRDNRLANGMPIENPLDTLTSEEALALRMRKHFEYLMCTLDSGTDDEAMEIFRNRRRILWRCMQVLLPDSMSDTEKSS